MSGMAYVLGLCFEVSPWSSDVYSKAKFTRMHTCQVRSFVLDVLLLRLEDLLEEGCEPIQDVLESPALMVVLRWRALTTQQREALHLEQRNCLPKPRPVPLMKSWHLSRCCNSELLGHCLSCWLELEQLCQ